MGFVFYDIETTGVKSAFDQILQFAAIHTDHELNEIDRFEIRSRLLPYVVPSPEAIEITGITVEQLTNPSLPSYYEMVRAIHHILNKWAPAIFIGHNSISFDEHFLRQAFYQTLHQPYLTNTNGNSRSDSIRIIQASSIYAPGAIKIPSQWGELIFKLDQLAPLNGFNHSNAHDALADVEATIHMCKLVQKNASNLWSNFIRFAQKASVKDFIEDEDKFTLSEFYFGKPYSWVVTSIGENPDRNNEILVFDLSIDPSIFSLLDDDALADRLTHHPKPIRSIRTNACPMLFPDDEAPDNIKVKLPTTKELNRRVALIKNDSALCNRLISAYLSTRGVNSPAHYVEAKIYEEFTNSSDTNRINQFQESDWSDRLKIVEDLSDERLRILGKRLIYTERRDLLDKFECDDLDKAFAKRLMGSDGDVPWLTLPEAILKADQLIGKAKGGKILLLKDLRKFLVEKASEATSYIK